MYFDGTVDENHERNVVFMTSEPILGSVGTRGLYNDRQEIELATRRSNALWQKPSPRTSCCGWSISRLRVCSPPKKHRHRPLTSLTRSLESRSGGTFDSPIHDSNEKLIAGIHNIPIVYSYRYAPSQSSGRWTFPHSVHLSRSSSSAASTVEPQFEQ